MFNKPTFVRRKEDTECNGTIDEHSSLLCESVHNGEKSFYSIVYRFEYETSLNF
jgi:hypothetical protein